MENLLTTALTPLLAALGALASGLIGWLAARTKNRAEAERTSTGAALDAAGEWQELYLQIRQDLLQLRAKFEEHRLKSITESHRQNAKIQNQEHRIRELERELKKKNEEIAGLTAQAAESQKIKEYNQQLEAELARYRKRLTQVELKQQSPHHG